MGAAKSFYEILSSYVRRKPATANLFMPAYERGPNKGDTHCMSFTHHLWYNQQNKQLWESQNDDRKNPRRNHAV
jgi:hypothetical protein